MLDEEKWLGITQGFRALRESGAENRESQPITNPNLRKNGIYQIEKPYNDGSCNKENEVEQFDEQRKKISQIPESRITGGGDLLGKSPFVPPSPFHKRNGISPRKTTESRTVEMAKYIGIGTGESRMKVDKQSKYLGLNHVQQMELKLRKSNRRLGEKSREVEEQARLIYQLRETLRTTGISETIQDVDHSNHVIPETNCSHNSSQLKTPEIVKDTSTLLCRLEKIEEKLDDLIKNLPGKIETVCMQVLRRELGDIENPVNADLLQQQQPKWNLLPTIKPKSNLAAKLRTNFRSGVQLDCNRKDNEDNIEQKIASLEGVVEQLKQAMIKMLLNTKKCK